MNSRSNSLNQIAAFSLLVTDTVNTAILDNFDRTLSEIETLISVRHCDNFTVGWLSEVLNLSHSAAVRIADRLEKDGLLKRIPQSNRKYVGLALTTSGIKLADKILVIRGNTLEELFSTLNDKELNMAMSAIRCILGSSIPDKLAAYRRCRSCDEAICISDCPVQRACH